MNYICRLKYEIILLKELERKKKRKLKGEKSNGKKCGVLVV